MDYIKRVLRAHVYDVAIESPLEPARRLSHRLGCQVLFKREDLQPVFSFKLRGAYNKIAHLTKEARGRGVICSSAGNHAQGVALAARRLGTTATIVMPTLTPTIKVQAVADLGAEIVIHGEAYDDAYEEAMRLTSERGLTFIHPFDDPEVIAGQGTIGMEILRQLPQPPDLIFVPIGGGGLMAGIASYVKTLYPGVRLIGVEPEDAPSMYRAFEAGGPVTLEHVGIFADGVAVRRVGEETYRVCRRYVDEILLVSTDEICAAVRDIFEDTRSIVEPAGALAVAGLKRYARTRDIEERTVVTLNCGANVNFDRLRHISERADIGEELEALLAVEIPERPGSFRAFCEALGARGVTEFNYRMGDVANAHIFVGVALSRGRAEKEEIIAELGRRGYNVLDLSGDELAKLHVRHMVGGAAPGLRDERIFRFEFPERPGALLKFLTAIGDQWNISLFHYRNHGSDYGRVLAGVQVPPASAARFESHLRSLRYEYCEETANPAYRLFLSAPAPD